MHWWQGSDSMEKLGDKLRSLRKHRGYSLQQAAEHIGCSPSYLSMVENQKLDPSISKLKKIAEGLGTTIVELFQEGNNDDVVMRAHKRPLASFPRSKLRIEILVPRTPGRQLDARLAIVSPGGGSVGDYHHQGEEFGLILEGSLELTVEGASYTLQQGDSFYFASSKDHRFINPGDSECKILWVNHPPSW